MSELKLPPTSDAPVDARTTDKNVAAPRKRTYETPSIRSEEVFERQALACQGKNRGCQIAYGVIGS